MPLTRYESVRARLAQGLVIPAHPLALDSNRKLDERRQRALTRYYSAAGAGGIAVAVHTTQFAIRNADIGLFEPVLQLAAEEMNRADRGRAQPLVRIGGLCGDTRQASREAQTLAELGYDAGLLSLAAMRGRSEADVLAHCRSVAEVLPIVGFYLQTAVSGPILSYRFWREFAEIGNVVAIKIAPFNRYRTLDVVRAVAESGRNIVLYTGNDDNIVMDLLTPFVFRSNGREQQLRIAGGLLGHWSVWTRRAVDLLTECHTVTRTTGDVPASLLRRAAETVDANAVLFDAANDFSGCIAGLHEILRRQGLLEGIWCLDPQETLSAGQKEEIDRIHEAYPWLNDDEFVLAGRDAWLTP